MISLSKDRFKTYNRKKFFILDKINSLPDLDPKDKEYAIYFDAVYYRVQTSIEAVMNIVSMLNNDLALQINDDYSNIDNLMKNQLISSELGKNLNNLNGLRNAIVHQYNGVDDNVIQANLQSIILTINSFVGVVENIIGKSN